MSDYCIAALIEGISLNTENQDGQILFFDLEIDDCHGKFIWTYIGKNVVCCLSEFFDKNGKGDIWKYVDRKEMKKYMQIANIPLEFKHIYFTAYKQEINNFITDALKNTYKNVFTAFQVWKK